LHILPPKVLKFRVSKSIIETAMIFFEDLKIFFKKVGGGGAEGGIYNKNLEYIILRLLYVFLKYT